MARFATAVCILLVCLAIAGISEARVKCGPNEVYQLCSRRCENCFGGGCDDVCIDANSRFGCYCKKGYCREGFGQCHSCIAGTLTAQGDEASSSANDCYLDPDPGPCLGIFERYFFNRRTGRCEIFYYGGCLGNGNNFRTEQECYDTCAPRCPPNEEYKVCSAQCDKDCRCNSNCNQPSQVPGCYCKRGFCRNRFGACTRIFTSNEVAAQGESVCSEPNAELQICSPRCERCDIGGGCGGICLGSDTTLSCYCKKGYCRSKWISQCVSKASDAFTTAVESSGAQTGINICILGPDPGTGNKVEIRYYFRYDTEKCHKFLYRGSGGNPNNFITELECYQKCGPPCKKKHEAYSVCSPRCDRNCQCYDDQCNDPVKSTACYCSDGYCRNSNGECVVYVSSNALATQEITPCCLEPGTNYQRCSPWCESCEKGGGCHPLCFDTSSTKGCYCLEGLCRSSVTNRCEPRQSSSAQAAVSNPPKCGENEVYKLGHLICETCYLDGCKDICLRSDMEWGCWCKRKYCRDGFFAPCTPCVKTPNSEAE